LHSFIEKAAKTGKKLRSENSIPNKYEFRLLIVEPEAAIKT
jgi:hypothetical protein